MHGAGTRSAPSLFFFVWPCFSFLFCLFLGFSLSTVHRAPPRPLALWSVPAPVRLVFVLLHTRARNAVCVRARVCARVSVCMSEGGRVSRRDRGCQGETAQGRVPERYRGREREGESDRKTRGACGDTPRLLAKNRFTSKACLHFGSVCPCLYVPLCVGGVALVAMLTPGWNQLLGYGPLGLHGRVHTTRRTNQQPHNEASGARASGTSTSCYTLTSGAPLQTSTIPSHPTIPSLPMSCHTMNLCAVASNYHRRV